MHVCVCSARKGRQIVECDVKSYSLAHAFVKIIRSFLFTHVVAFLLIF